MEDLAGDRFEGIFGAHKAQLERDDTLAGLLRHSTAPESFSPDSRRELLTQIERLQHEKAFASLTEPHVLLLEHLRTSIRNDEKIALHGPEAVREGWVTTDELERGKTYVVQGAKPFIVLSVQKDQDYVRVSVQNEQGYTALLLKHDTLVAPERTAAWQAVAVASAARLGITPAGAALWFAAGELYRLTHSDVPNEAKRWDRLLAPYTQQLSSESPKDFAHRILYRAYTGPIGTPGALDSKDVQDLRSLLLDLTRDTGVDLVRSD